MKLHIFHDWLYKYEKYLLRVHAFSTGPGPDWIDRKCSICGKLQPNKNYEAWLEFVRLTRKQIEYEIETYGHPLIHNVF